MNQKQTIGGTIIAYLLIVLNALYGIVLMPYIIGQIGAAEYGVYKTVSSFTSALMVLDLGMGSTAIRYIADLSVKQQTKQISSCVKILLTQAAVLAGVATVVLGTIYGTLDVIYRHGLTADEIIRAKQLFLILSVSVLCHLFENVFNGVISGFNRFLFANGIKLLRLCLRIGLTVALLQWFPNSLVLVTIDVSLILLLMGIELWYIRTKLGLQLQKGAYEKKLFLEMLKYSLTVFAMAIVSQISSNLDNVVVGAMKGSVKVAIYSVALQIYNMFLQIGSTVSTILMPTVVEILATDDDEMSKSRELVVKVGRVQFMLVGAVFAAFVVLGKQFIALLMGGAEYQDAYFLTVILMIPAIFELCINLCLAIIRAKNMLGFYTKMLIYAAVINLVITVVGTYFFDYYAAAFGTAVSLLCGNVCMMNAYYKKNFGFNMLQMYRQIFDRIWLCILVAALLCKFVSGWVYGWGMFICAACVFASVFAAMLWTYGLNADEKGFVKKVLSRG